MDRKISGNTANTFPKLEMKALNDQVYEEIRRAIVSGVIEPGSRLVVSEMASRFGVSQTPVKEAVARLEAEKLVYAVPRVGTFVSQLVAEEVEELFEIRLMIELFTASKIIDQVTDEQLIVLQELVEELSFHVEDDQYINFSEYIERDRNFHHNFMRLCGNESLIHIYDDLGAHLMITRAYYVKQIAGAKKAHEDHLAIVQKLRERDLEGLQKTLREHIALGKVNVLQAMLSEGVVTA